MVLPLLNSLILAWLYVIWPVELNKHDVARYFVFVMVLFNVICFYQYVICYYPDWLVRFGIVM